MIKYTTLIYIKENIMGILTYHTDTSIKKSYMKKARVHKIHLITIDKTTNDKVHSKPKLWVHVNEVMLAAK